MNGREGEKESIGWTMNATDRLGARLVWLAALLEKGERVESEWQHGMRKGGGNSFLNHYLGALYIITLGLFTYTLIFITVINLFLLLFHTKFLLILLNSQSAFTKRVAGKELVWWGI